MNAWWQGVVGLPIPAILDTRTIYIEPGSPWENPYVESFNSRTGDELVNIEEFGSLAEARLVVEAWRMEYIYRPHSSLDGLMPADFPKLWTATHQPILGVPSEPAALGALRRGRPAGQSLAQLRTMISVWGPCGADPQ